MATCEEFLKLIWENANMYMRENWIENTIRDSKRDPNAPFADLGPVIERLLKIGATKRELSLLMRNASYETSFGLLYQLCDPGIDDDDFGMLHESLLTADPSGKEGRPGSAPFKEDFS